MTTKLLIIGIDALDTIQIQKYKANLPMFRWLEENCPPVKLNSVAPPDSDTAWATIQTGMNPAQHGVIKYDDPLEKSTRLASKDVDNSFLRGKTFWDIASRAGKKVCILFPHLGYPVWPVNGIMVGRSGFDEMPATYPADLKFDVDPKKLNVVKGFPGRDKGGYIKANEELLKNQQALAEQLLQQQDWDLFFVYTSILDMIQHYFWNYCDPLDPSYPGPNPYENTIEHFYILHDQFVKKLFDSAGPETTGIVLSDHGHGMRPQKVFNVNEFLCENNWLILKKNQIQNKTAGFIDQTKHFLLEIISRNNWGSLASGLLRWMPWARKLYSSPVSIDWDRTRAFATNLSGVKAYTYGGIKIRRDGLDPQEYEKLRDEIIAKFSQVLLIGSDQPVLRWIKRREEIYIGPYLSNYPDLLFELQDGLGAGLTANGTLYGTAASHNLVPGSHRGDSAAFYIRKTECNVVKNKAELVDITPTICALLDLDYPANRDGISIVSLPRDGMKKIT